MYLCGGWCLGLCSVRSFAHSLSDFQDSAMESKLGRQEPPDEETCPFLHRFFFY